MSKDKEHHKKDPARAEKAEKPKTPKTVEAVAVLGFRVSAKEAVAPGERIELPYRDFMALKMAGKVVSAERFGTENKAFAKDEPKKKRGRPKKDAE